jgi:anthranilate synthase component 2
VGISPEVVRYFAGRVPILGVCLGHQIIGAVYGARVRRARVIKHGKTSTIRVISDSILFKNLPKAFEGMRYHSLVIDDVKEPLRVTAVSEDYGEVMAVEHIEYSIFGVQFHPESVGTQYGIRIIRNFLDTLNYD